MDYQQTAEGLIVSVKVRPASGRFSMRKDSGSLLVELSSPPTEGKANQELVSELSRLMRCEVRILSGMKSRKKILLLKGITGKEFELVLETH